MRIFTKALIKVAAPMPDLDSFQRYLFVGPHPDDIEVGVGATAAKLCRMGKEVEFLIVTDGRYGSDTADYDKEKLIEIRKQEALKSAEIIGAKKVTFLTYDDGGDYSETDIKNDILKKIVEFKADVVFTPDPLLKTECHSDHLKVGRATSTAFMFSGIAGVPKDKFGLEAYAAKALAYYYTEIPNVRYKVKKQDVETQIKALQQFPSQFKVVDNMDQMKMISAYIKFRALRAGFWRFKGRAQELRVVPNSRMHCFAEKAK